MVGIIDYGLGNLGSIQNMIKAIGEKSVISSKPEELDKCDRYILPGVGAFDAGMSKLNESGLVDYIKSKATNEKIAKRENLLLIGILVVTIYLIL